MNFSDISLGLLLVGALVGFVGVLYTIGIALQTVLSTPGPVEEVKATYVIGNLSSAEKKSDVY